MTPPMIRAMAQQLHDSGIDPRDDVVVAVTLIRAGFPALLVEHCFEAVQKMAMMRFCNDRRKAHEMVEIK